MNERMTRRDADGQAVMDCLKCEADWTGKHGNPMDDCTALYCRNRLKDRLAEYEDTGLTPELVREVAEFAVWVHENGMDKIREWVKADKEDRLVVLPWKVGEIVYQICGERTQCSAHNEYFDEYLCEGCDAAVCDSTSVIVVRAIKPNSLTETVKYIGEFGKTIFLTREEAEKALKEAGK